MRSREEIQPSLRVVQAAKAAEAGDGWTDLGKLWGMSNSGALMWCRTYVPRDVFEKIAENGNAKRKAKTYKPELREQVVKLREEEGLTFKQISERINLHIWRVHTIYYEVVHRRAYIGKPQTTTAPAPKPFRGPNQECRKATYHRGRLTECGAPTKGKTYCPKCAHGLVAMFDPPPKKRNTASASAAA